MKIGRWSELSVDRFCKEHELIKDTGANETFILRLVDLSWVCQS